MVVATLDAINLAGNGSLTPEEVVAAANALKLDTSAGNPALVVAA